MQFLLALQFLTRVPVTVKGQVTAEDMARSMAWFPFIGLLLGLAAAAVHGLASMVFTGPVSDFLAIALVIIITGNMHTDGLMDTADGIFSGRPREGMLEIMKDSRVGAHGVVAGVLVILAKFVLLGQLPAEAKAPALILAPVLGRWAQVYGAAVFPYARTGGGTGSFTDTVGRRELFWASLTVVTVIVGALFAFQMYILAGAAALLGSFATDSSFIIGVLLDSAILAVLVFAGNAGLARYIAGKLGGLTGDTYGALSECIEVLVLMGLLILFNNAGSFGF